MSLFYISEKQVKDNGGNIGLQMEIKSDILEEPVVSRTIWMIAQHGAMKGDSFEDRIRAAREYMRRKLQIVRESEIKYDGIVDYTKGVEPCQ